MILTATPYRVSMFGGGTDYEAWYSKHRGAVFGLALDRYCYVIVKPLPPVNDFKYRIAYHTVEDRGSIESIQHPAVRGVLHYMKSMVSGPLEIQHSGDLPARGGLGASSSFVVGLMLALRTLAGAQQTSARWLAEESTYVEQHVIGEAVGEQDQMFAAYGGVLHATFSNAGQQLWPIYLSAERQAELERSLVLVYSGNMRDAHVMAAQQIRALEQDRPDLMELAELAQEAAHLVVAPERSISELGPMLDRAWQLKRSICEGITTPGADALYARGRELGATGGKLLGAGGGGFMLFFVPPAQRAEFEREIGVWCVPVRIAPNGARVVINDP